MEPEQLKKQQEVLKLITVGVQLIVIGWFLLPDHTRQLILMRVIHQGRMITSTVAEKLGQNGMGVELATGREEYTLTVLVSKLRDKLTSLYEKVKN